MNVLTESHLADIPLLFRGKVRDVYDLERYLLIVATDRISAFDVVLPTPIPHKGRVLTQLSNFWFARTSGIVPNHLAPMPLEELIHDPETLGTLEGRAVIVRKTEPVKLEAVVRGYLVGSGWAEYRKAGTVCGISLPAGLRESERLPEPIFTPSTKAPRGTHDENITFEQAARLVGKELAGTIRDASLRLYQEATAWAHLRGIIIADTKFEFGLDERGTLTLIDEVLTPDSSRFWPADSYKPGANPPSFDKQYVRDYLESIGWNKKPPAPHLPPEVISRTAEKYREALTRLTGAAADARAAG